MTAPMPKPSPKPWVDQIAAYVPGKAVSPDGRPLIKLSANENPFGPPASAVAAMTQAEATAHRYPDGASTALREAIAAKYGLNPAHILCGAGSDDVLQLVGTAFLGQGDEALMSEHAFSVYPIVAARMGARPVEAPAKDYAADVDALLAAVTPATRVLFLANPNNPTGTLLPKAEVRRLHAALRPDILLVIDAAYAEYLGPEDDYEDGLAMSLAFDNVLVTRTFSKIHGLGGARVGWGHGPAHVIAAMDKVRGPFNVTSAGQAGAIAALADTVHAERSRSHNAHWRAWMMGELAGLANRGVRAIPSAANFIMLAFPPDGPVTAEGAYKALIADGYITRWLVAQGMVNELRITIGTAEETQGVTASLRRYVERAAA